MDINKNLLDFILSCANNYYEENLKSYSLDGLQADWWEAFDFFLWHGCYQGRRDVVSAEVYKRARSVLSGFFADEHKNENFNLQRQQNWGQVKEALDAHIGKGKVGKARDVAMIISALRFIDPLANRNIVAHSVEQIRSGRLKEHYFSLQAAVSGGGSTQVGPKVAAFYLRDIVSIGDLHRLVDLESAFCLQPIDTWVQQVAEKLGIVEKDAEKEVVQREIVRMSEEYGISAFRFNQGAWYLGTHSFDLLVEMAGRDEPMVRA